MLVGPQLAPPRPKILFGLQRPCRQSRCHSNQETPAASCDPAPKCKVQRGPEPSVSDDVAACCHTDQFSSVANLLTFNKGTAPCGPIPLEQRTCKVRWGKRAGMSFGSLPGCHGTNSVSPRAKLTSFCRLSKHRKCCANDFTPTSTKKFKRVET